MAAPWEQYANTESGPWSKYGEKPIEKPSAKEMVTERMKNPLDKINKGLEAAGTFLGEKLQEGTTALGASPEMAGAAGAAGKTGFEALTMIVPGAAGAKVGGEIGKLAAPALKRAGESVMQSALKPTLPALQKGQGQRAAKTMLEEGLNVTKGGLNTLQTKISALNDEATNIIAKSGEKVDLSPISESFNKLESRVLDQASWESDLKTVKQAFSEFLNNPQLKSLSDRIQDVPVQVAQRMKSATQGNIAKSYGAQTTDSWIQSQKAIARDLRQAIEKAVPEVKPLNEKQAELINALKVAERRDMISANKNPLGLALIASDPKAMAAFLADRSEIFKSLVARMLYSGSTVIPRTAGQVAGGAAGAAIGNSAFSPDENLTLRNQMQ